jgi:hypothetical protein
MARSPFGVRTAGVASALLLAACASSPASTPPGTSAPAASAPASTAVARPTSGPVPERDAGTDEGARGDQWPNGDPGPDSFG